MKWGLIMRILKSRLSLIVRVNIVLNSTIRANNPRMVHGSNSSLLHLKRITITVAKSETKNTNY